MTYHIQLTFRVKSLATKDDAVDFANSLAEHVLETFNDNNTISTAVFYKVLPPKKRGAK